MKISYNWLLKYINTKLSAQEIAEKLTSIGLEVEELEHYTTLPKGIENLIVGHIVELQKHPNADVLYLTKVDVGGSELLSIVCGAPNVAMGQKVIVAREGVTLYPQNRESFSIKKSKIRGEFSEGMLCAEDEIGLGESHAGLLILDPSAEIGKPVTSYLKGYSDWIFEIGLTPNRVDAASHIGVARDLAALLGQKVIYPDAHINVKEESNPILNISIEDKEGCPRYSGLIIKGIEVKESPEWIQNYLRAIGLKPINNIVDATNFVLHELGHPLHAFDLSKIEGNRIIIKKSEPGSTFATLDKQERKLDGSELMICNANEPIAIAGVFGGLKSAINSETKDIFIESAYFSPSSIRRTSRRHQLFTDASFRFERGADPNATIKALTRVASLIRNNAGGEIIGPVYDTYIEEIKPIQLKFEFKYLNAIAGAEIPVVFVKNILEGLEFKVLSTDTEGIIIEIPTFKTDVRRPIDVVEEVLRIYSFDNIPVPKQLKSIVQVDKLYQSEKLKKRINAFLVNQGFFETYMLSFVKEDDNKYHAGEKPTIPVLNPISADLSQVKNNILIPGLKALQHNINRQREDIRIFNWDHIHSKVDGKMKQEFRLGIWMTGKNQTENWKSKGKKVDFYDLKSMVEQIIKLSSRSGFESIALENQNFNYGSAYQDHNKKNFVIFGKVSDNLIKQFDLGQEVYYAEFDAKMLLKTSRSALKYDPISKFPKVERDLALIVPEELQYAQIREMMSRTDSKILKEISIFDVYKGDQVDKGFKSYAIRMVFEDKTQTLEDKTVDKIIQKIVFRLENELKVNIRS